MMRSPSLRIERIKAYPDRKVEVKFRIGETFEGTHGGQDSDPHESTYPVHELSFARVSMNDLLILGVDSFTVG